MKHIHLLGIRYGCLLAFLWVAHGALAQISPDLKIPPPSPIRFTPNPGEANLSGAGTPPVGDRGGGRRGNCPLKVAPTNSQLIPLIPEHTGWSATNQPSVLIYNPYFANAPMAATLVLRDEKTPFDSPAIAPIKVVLPMSPSVVKIPLTQPLEAKRLYRWYFTVICDEQNSSNNPYVTGLIRWVSPDPQLQQRITNASQLEKPALYAQQGFWYDALALLSTKVPSSAWTELLKSGSANLGAIAQEKVVPLQGVNWNHNQLPTKTKGAQ